VPHEGEDEEGGGTAADNGKHATALAPQHLGSCRRPTAQKHRPLSMRK
jgi:hypothetical protein